MDPFHAFVVMGLGIAAVAAMFDWKTGTIPDVLTWTTLCVAPLSHAAVAYGTEASPTSAATEALISVAGAASSALLPGVLFRQGGLGAGDVKLLAALGALTGPGFMMHAETYAFVLAMVQGLAIVFRRGALRATLGNVANIYKSSLTRRIDPNEQTPVAMTRVRLAPAVFSGTCLAALVLWQAP